MDTTGWPKDGHAHCYMWRGHGPDLDDNKRIHERREPAGALPPFVVTDWLAKDRRWIQCTVWSPKDGADWLHQILAEHLPVTEGTYGGTVDDVLTSARDQLARGKDVSVGRWLTGSQFLTLAVVIAPDCRSRHGMAE